MCALNKVRTGIFLSSIFALACTSVNAKQVTVSRLNKAFATKLITRELTDLKQLGVITHEIEPEDGQIFEIHSAPKFYFLPTVSKSTTAETAPWVCSILLFNESKKIASAVDVIGVNEVRPWTCDGVSALHFSSDSTGKNVRVIAIYSATAPSSERFSVPIVLMLDVTSSHLVIDESLTNKIGNVDTIKKALRLLKGL